MTRRHREGVKVWLYYFINLGARWSWVVNAMPQPPYPCEWPGMGFWVGPGPVWTGAENLAPTRIRLSDRPACSELLSRPHWLGVKVKISSNKSWGLWRGIEYWALTFDIVVGSASATLYLQGNFLVLISVREWVDPRLLNAHRRIRSLENFKDPTGNRARDLPSFGAVPQPTAPSLLAPTRLE